MICFSFDEISKKSMRQISIIICFTVSVLFPALAQNTLSYQWKPNSIYKFKAVQKDKISMGGGMMGMVSMAGDMEFKTESEFALKIDQLMPGGAASGSFYLSSFKCTDNKGNTLASM
jgi:hypothetical protein